MDGETLVIRKPWVGLLVFFLVSVWTIPAIASYKKTLKKWTRHEKVLTWDNLETRVVWHATYLSPDLVSERRLKIRQLTGDAFWQKEEWDDLAATHEVFLLVIYAGSSAYQEIGKEDGLWKFELELAGGEKIPMSSLSRIQITQVDRQLHPFLDQWSRLYRLVFPKQQKMTGTFHLHMPGVPAKSSLSWTAP